MNDTDAARAFPLQWPDGWRRYVKGDRKRARFKSGAGAVSVSQAVGRLEIQLKLLKVSTHVLSTNVPLSSTRRPISGAAEPDDVGVALYFQLGGQGRCMGADKWDRVADNICAIAYHLEAIRAMDRYGVGTVHQMFAGMAPRLQSSPLEWWLVLQIGRFHSTRLDIDRVYKKLAARHHPDVPGGSVSEMARINAAREAAYKDILE